MIKPVEKYAEDKQSILHIIYRLQSPSSADYMDDILHNGNGGAANSDPVLQDSNAIGECQLQLLLLVVSADTLELQSRRRRQSMFCGDGRECKFALDKDVALLRGREPTTCPLCPNTPRGTRHSPVPLLVVQINSRVC